MNELKFVNNNYTLGDLKELLCKEGKFVYQVIRMYDKQNSYETDYFFKYPDKYLNYPVLSCLIKNDLITILVYGGSNFGKEIYI